MGKLAKTPAWVLVVACAGCVATYNPPREQKQEYVEKVAASKERIHKVGINVLRRSGYRFAFVDQEEGRITTRPKTMRLTDRDCDCGTAMGMRFASDERTNTDVSFFILARDNEFSLRSIIEGQYVASDTSMVKRFHCVSRGGLEKDIIEKIKAGLSETPAETPAEEPQPEATDEPAADEL
jgi:hypothetical protein